MYREAWESSTAEAPIRSCKQSVSQESLLLLRNWFKDTNLTALPLHCIAPIYLYIGGWLLSLLNTKMRAIKTMRLLSDFLIPQASITTTYMSKVALGEGRQHQQLPRNIAVYFCSINKACMIVHNICVRANRPWLLYINLHQDIA